MIKDVDGMYFKGGTALNKIFLDHARLSEDIDFSLTKNISDIKKEITELIVRSQLFETITQDKDVEGFLRIVVGYLGFDRQKDVLFIDLNQRAKLTLPSEEHKVHHFYAPFIPSFSVKTLSQKELMAEKVAATIGRNKPRDHYDVYMMLKKGITFDMNLVKDKCHASGDEFSIIKMFNKAKLLKRRWDQDMVSLLATPISFQEVMKFLSNYFKFKEEKEKLKKK